MLEGLLTQAKLWRCARVGASVQALGRIWIHGDGEIEIGAHSVLDGRAAPIELRTAKGGRLLLGEGVRIDGGASLEAEGRIVLGARVQVHGFAKIIDNHFHRVTGDRHARPPPGEVLLEDDVVVGEGAILLPGAVIGRGARIGPRSVVSRRIPAGVKVSGNPARIES